MLAGSVALAPSGMTRRREGPEILAAEGAARLDAELAAVVAAHPGLSVERDLTAVAAGPTVHPAGAAR